MLNTNHLSFIYSFLLSLAFLLLMHLARHIHATMMLTLGADLYTISKLLGHNRVTTTQIYGDIIDQKKREAVNLIPDFIHDDRY